MLCVELGTDEVRLKRRQMRNVGARGCFGECNWCFDEGEKRKIVGIEWSVVNDESKAGTDEKCWD